MFRIVRSERADALADSLVEVIEAGHTDVFAPEIVAVPTRGVERWLTHRIAARAGTTPGREDGVCANIRFPFPGRLVGDVLATAVGVDRDTDPWRVERLVWTVLDVLTEHADDEWLAPLAAHVAASDGDRLPRRYDTARHAADLFDRYSVFRPGLVCGWLDPSVSDEELQGNEWQRTLFRHVHERIGCASPPERIGEAVARLQAGEVDLDLPPRISLFGLTRLPATYLEVLGAVAAHRDVHLFALHPSMALWDQVSAIEQPLPAPRRDDETRSAPRHPLLRTWAQDSREMQLVLQGVATDDDAHRPVTQRGATTLLRRLQADVAGNVEPADADRLVLDDGDVSVQVHACHGRHRQVEVLRDTICRLMSADPTLQPRDVIVLCPDIEEFAPILHAVFGARPEPDGRGLGLGRPTASAGGTDATGLPHIPYRLADRSLRQSNPMLAALSDLLELVEGRLTATEVLRFAGRAPVRSRFGFDDDDLERLAGWVNDAGARWGLDGSHRARWKVPVRDQTWEAALERLLLGVVMDTDDARLLGGRLPLDDVEAGDIDLAGRLAELVDRLAHVVGACAGEHPVADWIGILADATDLLLAAPGGEGWQRVQVDTVLRDTLTEATGARGPSPVGLLLGEVRALLAGRLRGVPTTADFRTGALTMCTLVPMRAVPHRVVCVLGLDDGVFPRPAAADGDDLLLVQPLIGDRDPRAEDRQLLLDAVLAATDHLVVTYSGRDERTNEERPRSVPLHELLAVLDRTGVTHDARPAGLAVVTDHPLQPFDPRAFDGSGPRSFDRVQLAGARATLGPRHGPEPFLDGPLPERPEDTDTVGLDDLVQFLVDPVKAFLRRRLEIQTWERDDTLPDRMTIEPDGLDAWRIGDRILGDLRAGVTLDDAVHAEIGRGLLPPGSLRDDLLRDAANTARHIHSVAAENGAAGIPASIGIDVPLGGGTRLVGTVPAHGHGLVADVSYSNPSPRTRLRLWIQLLAATMSDPDLAWATLAVGRAKGKAKIVRHGLDDLPADRDVWAGMQLDRLVSLFRTGHTEPLLLPLRTAEAYASERLRGRDAVAAARREWDGRWKEPGECGDRSLVRVLGPGRPLEDLLAIPPTPAETGDDWPEETSRFGRIAVAVWRPLLERERYR